jgi:hypothetical protein
MPFHTALPELQGEVYIILAVLLMKLQIIGYNLVV